MSSRQEDETSYGSFLLSQARHQYSIPKDPGSHDVGSTLRGKNAKKQIETMRKSSST